MKHSLKTDFQQIWAFSRLLARRFKEERCAQMAASLTFTTLLSIVPLITIALTLFAAFPVFTDIADHLRQFILSNMLPETGGKLIARYMEQFAESAARLTAFGVIFLGVTAMLLMLTIDNAFNQIWRVSHQRNFIQRVLVYWAVLTLGPIMIGGSLSVTSWLAGMSTGYVASISQSAVVLIKLLPFVLTGVAFTLLYRVVPNRFVPLQHAIAGGVVAAVLFESMNRLFAFYITHFGTYKLIYGAFASLPIFLMWIYLSWFAVLLGALIAASLSHWRSQFHAGLTPVQRLHAAVTILLQLKQSMAHGRVVAMPRLAATVRMGYDDLEALLEVMARANLVRKLARQGWAMIRDADHIRMGELVDLFLFDSRSIPAGGDVAHTWIAAMDLDLARQRALTLTELETLHEHKQAQ